MTEPFPILVKANFHFQLKSPIPLKSTKRILFENQRERGNTYRASSRAARGLLNRPLLSILGIGTSFTSSAEIVGVRRALLVGEINSRRDDDDDDRLFPVRRETKFVGRSESTNVKPIER